MRFLHLLSIAAAVTTSYAVADHSQAPIPAILRHARTNRNVSAELFAELEELARIVDISYCVGLTSWGISKPFKCLSRCSEFPEFELVTTWHTGPLLSDSCGYIALDHGKKRVIVAFRGTYSVANTIVDLSTVPQEYVPYPGADDDETVAGPHDVAKEILGGVGGHEKRNDLHGLEKVDCENCTVHMGFHAAWLHTREAILPDLLKQLLLHPDYQLNFVGHSLGGAVAALGALEMKARAFDPVITTFGEPRVGNKGLMKFIDDQFNLMHIPRGNHKDANLKYRRLTHIDDPVPLLPLSEWGFAMHAGEIYISKSALSPDITDLEHCYGDTDQECIAGQDSTTAEDAVLGVRKRDLLTSVEDEVHEVIHEPWGIPSRYKLWQLFFAHRDYFWRLGLCAPSMGGGLEQDEDPKLELR